MEEVQVPASQRAFESVPSRTPLLLPALAWLELRLAVGYYILDLGSMGPSLP